MTTFGKNEKLTLAPTSPTPMQQNKNPVWYVSYLLFVKTHTLFGIKKALKLTLLLKYNNIWLFDHSAGAQRGGVKKVLQVSNWHTNFVWISSNGLGVDSIMGRRMDRQTDGRTEDILSAA